jgi:hypothetical protein
MQFAQRYARLAAGGRQLRWNYTRTNDITLPQPIEPRKVSFGALDRLIS